MADFEATQSTDWNEPSTDSTANIDTEAWGKLEPLCPETGDVFLSEDHYVFGRHASCNFNLTGPTISNKHFTIMRPTSQDTDVKFGVPVFLEDTSTNGTYVNGKKVGKGERVIVESNSVIGVKIGPSEVKKIYQYKDLKVVEGGIKNPIAPYEFQNVVLGAGSFAEVKLAVNKENGLRVAVKCIDKRRLSMQGSDVELRREVDILKSVEHPCIIEIFDVFETNDMLYIVLELVSGGALFEYVVEKSKLSEQECKLFFYQMLVAMKYLHNLGISHRDLKPENILLEKRSNGDVIYKITDFGLAKIVGEASFMQTLCGTPNYLAPEVVNGGGVQTYTNRVDCWSLGVILYICLVGYPPFADENNIRIQQVTKGKFYFDKDDWEYISEDALDLVKKLLTPDPKDRYTIDQALEHPWMANSTAKLDCASLFEDTKQRKLKARQGSMSTPKRTAIEKEEGDDTQVDQGKKPKLSK